MQFVIFNRDYPGFLRELYLASPGLHKASYAEQLAARNESLFGVADFYSRNFIAHGHQAIEIHLNNPWLQYAWAREHGVDVAPPAPPHGVVRAKALLAGIKRRFSRLAHRALSKFAHPLSQRAAGADWEHLVLRAQIADFSPDVILNQEMAAMRSPVLRIL